MSKEEELKKLEEEIAADKNLPLDRANLIFGEGSINPKVLFIGEAPGREEDRQKRPFVGRSGKLLDKLIEELGWRREEVYITNIVKRRPPENRDPLPDEIAAYKPYLTRQIEIINPPLIATLGRFSMNYFLPEAKISRDQGRLFKIDGRYIYPLLHPAAALRSPDTMGAALHKAFLKLPAALKKCRALMR
jgi:DNA polymerase